MRLKTKVFSLLMLCFTGIASTNCAQRNEENASQQQVATENQQEKMKVEIWSDVMCPFCYIGKRKFEKALEQFPYADKIEIEWKSFQLNPDLETNPDITAHESLAAHKGISVEQAKAMSDQVVQMARTEGLTYNMDQAVVANSFNAHRFSHLAKEHGVQHEAEEALFRAYFTEGKNIDNNETLADIGVALGIDRDEVLKVLNSDDFDVEVRMDLHEARQIGVTGVPFFVFDRKYAVSGAQPSEVFLETLEKALAEWAGKK